MRVDVNRTDVMGAIAFVALGMWVSHFCHVIRFYAVGWSHISAFPDWSISTGLSLYLSPVIPLVVLVACYACARRPSAVLFACAIALSVVTSEVIGRSFFKVLLDLACWGTVISGLFIRHTYDARRFADLSPDVLRVVHAELLGVLRTGINVCLFVLGTLTISVISNLIARYFDEGLGQVTAWAYVIGVVYLACGLAVFIVTPLFRSMLQVRVMLSTTTRAPAEQVK